MLTTVRRGHRWAAPLALTLVLSAALLLAARPALAVEDPLHAAAEKTELTHGEAAYGHENAEHGAHHSPGIENWFSFSYGEGEEHEAGPFGFAIVNFILLLWLLSKFARKPFQSYLEDRHVSIRDNLAEATRMREEAQAKLEAIEAKLKNLDQEISEIKEGVAKDAEEEKKRILDEAQAEAERIVKQADKTLERDIRRARRMLESEAVSAAMQAAEKLIKKQINDADRNRLNEEYFTQIASTGGNN